MGVYLGRIKATLDEQGKLHSKFKLLAELKNSKLNSSFNVPSHDDITFGNPSNIDVTQYFCDGSLLIIQLNDKDINYGYIDIEICIRKKRFKFIHEENIFQLYNSNFLFSSTGRIAMGNPNILLGEKILLDDGMDFFAGPYTVERNPKSQRLYVQMQTDRHSISGYSKTSGTIYTLPAHDGFAKTEVFIPNDAAKFEKRITSLPNFSKEEATHSMAKPTIAELQKEIANLQQEIYDLKLKLDQYARIKNLQGEIYYLEKIKSDLIDGINKLQGDKREAEKQFNELFHRANSRMAEIAFDSVMANKMLEAASKVDTENLDREYADIVEKVQSVAVVDKPVGKLAEYLHRTVQKVRPNYGYETVVNIAICITQSFLTIFYGAPGCGKTSICDIFAKALGLNKIAAVTENPRAGRYVSVSVEKGWTSKRDFIGYYNPLSKTFDRSNRRVYDALRLLDMENRKSIYKLPYLILLDEANLSPPEYYWSDFMNLCDGVDENSHINLGEDYLFSVPETLRFIATINADHTTEELSPRLIDRAWIIILPDAPNILAAENAISDSELEVISWRSLREAFDKPSGQEFPASFYNLIIEELHKVNISFNARVHRAVQRYWSVATKFFNRNVAIDYAIAQKILPRIQGSGEAFKKWLKDFQSVCSANGSDKSAKIIQGIIERGDNQMGYYRFFG